MSADPVPASIHSRHFVLHRLHSLLGLLPLGAFLIFHPWENSQSRLGAEHYNERVVASLHGMNYLPLIELFAIALPLLFQAGYGLVILAGGRAEPLAYPFSRNRLYWLQRVSGLGLVLFLLLHVGLTRIAGLLDPAISADLFGHMRAALSQPWVFLVYLGGLWLAVLHLANGLATAASRCWQQGAHFANGEFFQFHPTAMLGEDKTRLMSEAARGEGGRVWVPRTAGDRRDPLVIPERERFYFLEKCPVPLGIDRVFCQAPDTRPPGCVRSAGLGRQRAAAMMVVDASALAAILFAGRAEPPHCRLFRCRCRDRNRFFATTTAGVAPH